MIIPQLKSIKIQPLMFIYSPNYLNINDVIISAIFAIVIKPVMVMVPQKIILNHNEFLILE
jgi:hypothetical protein